MASNGVPGDFSVANVLAAMSTMRATDSDRKQAAMDYLGKFQKSVCSPYRANAHPVDKRSLTVYRKMPGRRPSLSYKTRPKQKRSSSPRQH